MFPLLLLACAPDAGSPQPGTSDLTFAFSTVHDEGLSADAEAAIARMPAWLQPDLRLALVGVSSSDREGLVAAILGVEDPRLLDEVGFAMAHLSPGVLSAKNFYPELLVENAALVYEVDPFLDYVELVETGEAGVDADWSTTARYQVEVDGEIESVEIDPEIYYWYVVHPRIEDENPWYVDAWDECTRSTLECAATPETGTFWRRFLWDAAAEDCPEGESCPIAADYLPGAQVLWGAADADDAVHRVAGMMLDSPDDQRWLSFGAYGERSIQPNRIYALGRGNCGEWADMTTALSRTGLIPNVNVTPSSWDHTWSAFWQEGWVAWEPVNWWFDHDYASGYVTYATRGDTAVFLQTEQYNESTATFEVQVVDADGAPVDGASVVLWTPYESSWWYAGELVTTADGYARFTVGADKQVGWLVMSALGGGGSLEGTVDGIAVGETESVVTQLDDVLPRAAEAEAAGEGGTLGVDVTVTAEGRVMGESYRLDDTSAEPTDTPVLTTWLLTWADYAAFEAGEPFGTWDTLPPDEGGVVVVGNFDAVATAAVGELALRVEGTGIAAATDTRPFALLPGEWLAVGIGD